MTREEKRILIAMDQGARIIEKEFPRKGGPQIGRQWAWNSDELTPCSRAGGGYYGHGWSEEAYASQLPDYFGCLNACRKMEEKLKTTDEWDCYIKHLNDVTQSPMWSHRFVIGAEPRERAEAYGLARGLWKEGE